MSRIRWHRKFGSIGLAAAVVATTVVTVAAAGVAAAAPGTPGTPQAPLVVYTEDFEHGMGNTAVQITNYTGAPPVNATYDADPAWLANCDGWVLNAVAPDPAGSGCNGRWPSLQQMASILGQYAGTGATTNHALGEESAFVPVGADKVVVETATPIPLSGASRFLTFSVDVTEVGCAGVHSLLKFYLMDGATAIPTFNTPIEACVNPPTTINGIPVGTYTSDGPVLFSGAAMGWRLVNGQGGFAGNDFSIDNIRVLDVTPQLDKTFAPATVQENGATTLTYTITNTDELAEKNGWSLTDTMPAGLSVVPGSATTNCSSGTALVSSNTVTVAGNLNTGQAACSATVQVTAAAPGAYQSCGANVTAVTGISRPGCASVTFTADPTVAAGGPYSGQEGAAVAIAGTVSDPDSPNPTTNWTVAPGAGVDPGATCVVADPTDPTTTVTCTDDGPYILTLTASDGFNPPVAATTTLTLFNQAPTVTITAPSNGIVVATGATVGFTAPFADPGANDTHTCTVDFDDGSPVGNGTVNGDVCAASHGFTVPGTHNVLVTVFDDDGASATDVVAVVVNAPPVVDAGGPYAGVEGAGIAIAGTVTDPDGPDLTTTWAVEPGAGVDAGATCALADAAAVTTSVTCTDDGTFTLRLTADDGINAPVTATATLTVANAAPVVTIATPADGALFERGDPVTVTAPFTDAGANDTHTCAVDFGDGTAPVAGTVADGACAAAHTYAALGPHTITVTVTDDDGGTGADTVLVVVFVTGEAWALSANGPVTIAKTPHAVCPPDATLTQIGVNVPGVVNSGTLNASCTVSPTTGVTRAAASVEGATLLGGAISISTIESTCLAGPDGLTGSSLVGTINGRPIGSGSGSITIPLVATVHYNQTVTTPTGELFQYAIRVQTLLGQEIVLGACRVG